ncbi:hypothetical protein D3C81_749610 [compost metagenome]
MPPASQASAACIYAARAAFSPSISSSAVWSRWIGGMCLTMAGAFASLASLLHAASNMPAEIASIRQRTPRKEDCLQVIGG